MRTKPLAGPLPTPLAVAAAGRTVPLESLVELAAVLGRRSRTPETLRAYRRGHEAFVAFCDRRGLVSFPAAPEAMALFAVDLWANGRALATVKLYLSAVSVVHDLAGHGPVARHPVVAAVVRGMGKVGGGRTDLLAGFAPDELARLPPALVAHLGELGGADGRVGRPQPVRAFTTAEIHAMLRRLPYDPRGDRDRLLIALGFASSLRRSELAALDVADVELTPDGLWLAVRRGKTDQGGEGRRVFVPAVPARTWACPRLAFQTWMGRRGDDAGALFCHLFNSGRARRLARLCDRSICRVVQWRARAAGIPGHVGGHSLRRGFATEAAKLGHSERAIMRQTGHTSVRTVRRYIADGEAVADCAARGLL